MQKNVLFFSLLLLGSCGRQDADTCQDTIDVSKIPLKLEVVHLEKELFACKSKQDIQTFIQKHEDLFKRYDKMPIKKAEDSLQNRLWEMVKSPYMDTLYTEVNGRFYNPKNGKWKQVEQDFELAFKHIKHYYPAFQPPKIYTTLTGLGSFWGAVDIFMDRQAIVISLEFYYGQGARYRPDVKMMPDYIWKRFVSEAIVPSCLLNISNQYNATDVKDQTMLADMVYFGKAYAFVKEMMPCLPDSLLTGYTQKDLANINDKENRQYIWDFLVEKKAIFSTSPRVKAIYMQESPYVVEINQKCPGRIGRWLGWRIIRKYRQKFPDISLQDLMKKGNARELFEASGYSGQ
jgi:hypothetical protein